MSELQIGQSSVPNPLSSKTKHVVDRRSSMAQSVDWDAVYYQQTLLESKINPKTKKPGAIWCGGVSHDGRFVVAGSHDGLFARDMLDGPSGSIKKVVRVEEVGGGVTALAFDPDKGRSLAYLGSSKGKIVKVDLQKGTIVAEFGEINDKRGERISSLAMSKDGGTLVSICPDNKNAQASIWSLTVGEKPKKVKDLDVKAPMTGTCAISPHSIGE